LAIKYLAGERIIGTAAERLALTIGADTLGTSANGSLIGDPTGGDTSPTPPTGLGTSSFNFDGNDLINIDGALSFSASSDVGTISMWLYNDGTSSGKAVLMFGDTNATRYLGFETKTDGIAAQMNDGGTQWEIRRNSSNNGGALEDAWHHCVLSQDGTAVKMYVDGVYLNSTWDNTTDKSKWMESGIDNGRIGGINRSGYGNTDIFTGNIMEVALWNVALTEAQVQSLYGNGGSTAKTADTIPAGLKAYYPLSGTVVTNAAVEVYPNLSNGTIFEESDTGKHYMFDGTSTWNEMS